MSSEDSQRQVVLVRHAECVDLGHGIGELERFLTVGGRVDARKGAEVALARGARPETILTSPLVRAVQTAEIIASVLGLQGEVRSSVALHPGAAPELLAEALEESAGDMLVVGHAPDMRARTSLLLDLPRARVPMFSRAMMVAVTLSGSSTRGAQFDWAWDPLRDEVVETVAELAHE